MKNTQHPVYLGAGSNTGDSVLLLKQARQQIGDTTGTLLATASLYRTAPIGPVEQPWFYNTVFYLMTSLDPWTLLNQLQTIENHFGRTRQIHWGPRTMDLDILLYDNLELQHPQLTLPHPELHRRAFVLYPLLELNPVLTLPCGQLLSNFLPDVKNQHIEKQNGSGWPSNTGQPMD